jgi:hypothetical protein
MTPRVDHPPRICPGCQEPFPPRRITARFCSPRCRVATFRKKRRETLTGQRPVTVLTAEQRERIRQARSAAAVALLDAKDAYYRRRFTEDAP